MINDLNIAPRNPVSTDLQRMIRNAQWRANLPFRQRVVYVVADDNGVMSLSTTAVVPPVPPATGPTQLAVVYPNPNYLSGMREEWREPWMHLGDRTY